MSRGETPEPKPSSQNGGSFQGPPASVGALLRSFLSGIAPSPFPGLKDSGVGVRCSGSGLLPLNISGFEHQQEVARAGRTATHTAPASAPAGTRRLPQTGIESVNHTGVAAAADQARCRRGCRPHAPRFTFYPSQHHDLIHSNEVIALPKPSGHAAVFWHFAGGDSRKRRRGFVSLPGDGASFLAAGISHPRLGPAELPAVCITRWGTGARWLARALN